MLGRSVPQLSPDAIRMMNAMAAIGYKDVETLKDAGTTAGAMLHGPGGMLATLGLSKQVMNAMIMPRGLAGQLQVRPSVDTNEIFGILTGLQASTGSEPTTACSDWPTVGQFKLCRQQHPFGQQGRTSQVLNIKYAGQIINRGEFTDNVLFGKPNTGDDRLPGAIDWTRALQIEHEKKLAELFLGYFRDYAPFVYTGNPANTAGSQGGVQYRGLDLLINTNKADAITGILCPAADSIVISGLSGTSVNTNGAAWYNIIANVVTNFERLAEQLSLDVKWAITGRYGAFWTLTNVWPCVYATTGCYGLNAAIHTQSLNEAVDERDKMRNGRYLMIEGKPYDFIIDDSVAETIAAGGATGTYQSDVYLIPMTANGEPMTFFEFFPMVEQAIAAANAMAPGGYFSTLDNGRFLLSRLSPTHTCVQVEIIERPRLVLMAPFLAARFQGLRYTISVHERDAFPSSPYWVDGGSPTTPLPYFYPQSGSNG